MEAILIKRFAAIFLAAALFSALLTGCAGTNYGYDGNVSTTDNGYVNGTNDGKAYNDGIDNNANSRGVTDNIAEDWDDWDNTDHGSNTTGSSDRRTGPQSNASGHRNDTADSRRSNIRPGMGTSDR